MNIKSTALRRHAAAASRLLKRLSHPGRLMVVCHLLAGERPVGELAAGLGLRESTTSQHLAHLRADGLVLPRRAGQTVYYRLASPAVRDVLRVLYRHYCEGKK